MRYAMLFAIAALHTQCAHQGKVQPQQYIVKLSDRPMITIPSGKSYGLADVELGQSRLPWTAALLKGDWEKAQLLAKSSLQSKPYAREALTALAIAYLGMQQTALANYTVDLVLAVHPTDSAALNAKGLVVATLATQVYQYSAAIEFFHKALSADVDNYAAAFNLGYLQLYLQQPQAALQTFSVAAKKCNHCVAAITGLGLAHLQLQQEELAYQYFQDVQKLDQQNVFVLAKIVELAQRSSVVPPPQAQLAKDKLLSLLDAESPIYQNLAKAASSASF
jgi:Tfp pilus assembly protein PilF